MLPGRNVLIPLFYLDHVHIHGDARKLRKGFLWLLRATRDGRYSGSAITTIDQDLNAITSAKDCDAALHVLHQRLDAKVKLNFSPADMRERYDQNKFLCLMLYLVAFHNKAEDWKTGQLLGIERDDNSLNYGFRPEWHHFVPKARLKRRPHPPIDDEMNALANIAVVSEVDNRSFSSSEPLTYLAKFNIPFERVHQQFFPDPSLWSSQKYEEFIKERSKLLAEGMNEFVKWVASEK
jgi:hypothetical protein